MPQKPALSAMPPLSAAWLNLRRVSVAPLVVDPVMISKHGAPLIAEEACAALWNDLLPAGHADQPNLHERLR